jgi:hypothetical protein
MPETLYTVTIDLSGAEQAQEQLDALYQSGQRLETLGPDIAAALQGAFSGSGLGDLQSQVQQAVDALNQLASAGGTSAIAQSLDTASQSASDLADQLQQVAATGEDLSQMSGPQDLAGQLDDSATSASNLSDQLDQASTAVQNSGESADTAGNLWQSLGGVFSAIPFGQVGEGLGTIGEAFGDLGPKVGSALSGLLGLPPVTGELASSAGEMASAVGAGEGAMALLGPAAVAAGAALAVAVEGIHGFNDTVGSLMQMSNEFGITTDQAGAFKSMIESVGGSGDQADAMLLRLSSNLSSAQSQLDAGHAASGRFVDGLNSIGVSVTDTDGKVQSISDLMPQIIERFTQIHQAGQDGAGGINLTNAAADIFGTRTGPQFISMLEQQGISYQDALSKQQAFGDGSAANVQKYLQEQVALTELHEDLDHVAVEIGSAVVPALTALATGAEHAFELGEQLGPVWHGAGDAFTLFGTVVHDAAAGAGLAIDALAMGVGVLMEGIGHLPGLSSSVSDEGQKIVQWAQDSDRAILGLNDTTKTEGDTAKDASGSNDQLATSIGNTGSKADLAQPTLSAFEQRLNEISAQAQAANGSLSALWQGGIEGPPVWMAANAPEGPPISLETDPARTKELADAKHQYAMDVLSDKTILASAEQYIASTDGSLTADEISNIRNLAQERQSALDQQVSQLQAAAQAYQSYASTVDSLSKQLSADFTKGQNAIGLTPEQAGGTVAGYTQILNAAQSSWAGQLAAIASTESQIEGLKSQETSVMSDQDRKQLDSRVSMLQTELSSEQNAYDASVTAATDARKKLDDLQKQSLETDQSAIAAREAFDLNNPATMANDPLLALFAGGAASIEQQQAAQLASDQQTSQQLEALHAQTANDATTDWQTFGQGYEDLLGQIQADTDSSTASIGIDWANAATQAQNAWNTAGSTISQNVSNVANQVGTSLPAGGSAGSVGPSGSAAEANTALASGAYAPAQLAQMAYNAGFRGNDLETIVAIALRESGGNPTQVNPTSGATGVLQFLASTWAGYGGVGSPTNAQESFNIAFKAEQARGGFGDWGGWNEQLPGSGSIWLPVPTSPANVIAANGESIAQMYPGLFPIAQPSAVASVGSPGTTPLSYTGPASVSTSTGTAPGAPSETSNVPTNTPGALGGGSFTTPTPGRYPTTPSDFSPSDLRALLDVGPSNGQTAPALTVAAGQVNLAGPSGLTTEFTPSAAGAASQTGAGLTGEVTAALAAASPLGPGWTGSTSDLQAILGPEWASLGAASGGAPLTAQQFLTANAQQSLLGPGGQTTAQAAASQGAEAYNLTIAAGWDQNTAAANAAQASATAYSKAVIDGLNQAAQVATTSSGDIDTALKDITSSSQLVNQAAGVDMPDAFAKLGTVSTGSLTQMRDQSEQSGQALAAQAQTLSADLLAIAQQPTDGMDAIEQAVRANQIKGLESQISQTQSAATQQIDIAKTASQQLNTIWGDELSNWQKNQTLETTLAQTENDTVLDGKRVVTADSIDADRSAAESARATYASVLMSEQQWLGQYQADLASGDAAAQQWDQQQIKYFDTWGQAAKNAFDDAKNRYSQDLQDEQQQSQQELSAWSQSQSTERDIATVTADSISAGKRRVTAETLQNDQQQFDSAKQTYLGLLNLEQQWNAQYQSDLEAQNSLAAQYDQQQLSRAQALVQSYGQAYGQILQQGKSDFQSYSPYSQQISDLQTAVDEQTLLKDQLSQTTAAYQQQLTVLQAEGSVLSDQLNLSQALLAVAGETDQTNGQLLRLELQRDQAQLLQEQLSGETLAYQQQLTLLQQQSGVLSDQVSLSQAKLAAAGQTDQSNPVLLQLQAERDAASLLQTQLSGVTQAYQQQLSVLQAQSAVLSDQVSLSQAELAASGETGSTNAALLSLQVQRDQASLRMESTSYLDAQISRLQTQDQLAADQLALQNVGVTQQQAALSVQQDQTKLASDTYTAQNSQLQAVNQTVAGLDQQIAIQQGQDKLAGDQLALQNASLTSQQNALAVQQDSLKYLSDSATASNQQLQTVNSTLASLNQQITVLQSQDKIAGDELAVQNESLVARQNVLTVQQDQVKLAEDSATASNTQLQAVDQTLTGLQSQLSILQAQDKVWQDINAAATSVAATTQRAPSLAGVPGGVPGAPGAPGAHTGAFGTGASPQAQTAMQGAWEYLSGGPNAGQWYNPATGQYVASGSPASALTGGAGAWQYLSGGPNAGQWYNATTGQYVANGSPLSALGGVGATANPYPGAPQVINLTLANGNVLAQATAPAFYTQNVLLQPAGIGGY